MSRYWLAAGMLAAVFLALFVAVEALGIPLLVDPQPALSGGGAAAALLGIALLTVDVLLPVPSSAVMVLHGALFGIWLGALLSLVGSLGAAAVGFAIGRAGGPALERFVSPAGKRRANRLLERWGPLAIVVTRPVPILAETVAILAGASRIGWPRAMAAALLGSLPAALLYAMAGASLASAGNFILVFFGVLVIAGAIWLLGRRISTPTGLPHE